MLCRKSRARRTQGQGSGTGVPLIVSLSTFPNYALGLGTCWELSNFSISLPYLLGTAPCPLFLSTCRGLGKVSLIQRSTRSAYAPVCGGSLPVPLRGHKREGGLVRRRSRGGRHARRWQAERINPMCR